IKIEDNIFTEDKIILNLHGKNLKKLSEDDACYLSNIIFDQSDIYPNMMISATIELKEMKLIDKPIMGIFKFIPGFIGYINQKLCVGYMEKDWGNAFPKSYVWIQCSRFERNRNSMFFFSIGRVPFIFMNKPIFKINGFLSVLLNDDKLFSFSIFHCIIKKFEVQKDFTNDKELVKVELSSIRNMKLIVNVERKLSKSGIHLRAPTKDGMSFNVEKHLHVKITIKLTRGNKILFFDASNFCDLEKVGNMEYFYK
ncbi:33204_t:CDS:2, partial [Gigaspora margarita]